LIETPTATPTETPTPTATFTPTPDYYIELVTPGGEPARVSREMSIADYWIVMLLIAILISMWVIHFSNRFKQDGKGGAKSD
jgi:hypothetical protein